MALHITLHTQSRRANAFTRGRGSAGNLTLQARDTVSFEGVGSNGVYSGALSTVQPEGIGNAGDLTIDTKRLVVRDGAEITATTFGKGNAGNLTVYASDSVELSGEEPSVNGQVNGRVSFPSGLFAQVDREGQGKAGSLTIETQRLNVSNGSKVQAATFGDGDAGNLLIRADEVNVSAAQPTFWNTAINAGVSVDPRTVSLPKGKGGNLTIETGRLSIQSTTAEGIKPVEVTVDTAGEGNAGTLLVQAHDLVEVVGENSFLSADVTRSAVGQGGDLNIETQRLSVRDGGQVSASTFPRTTGNAGNLVVRASDSVEVLNSGSIAVSSAGRGDAGSLTINTPAIRLDNQGKILAETRSGQGGNIILNVQDILLMRRNSQISTTAGTAQAGGDGGNITIDAPRGFLVTAPNENNDITANAFSGKGGNIRINGQGIYWFTPLTRSELRQRLDKINPSLPLDPTFLTTNDITASSNLGVSGTVTINILNFDPSRGLVQLPTGLADASRQITQRCSRSSQRLESSFYITGNSGLAERPGDPPISSFPTGDVQTIAANQPAPITQTPAPSPPPTSPLVEAQKWIRNTNGDIYLVANSADAIVHLPIARPTFCP